MIIGIGNDLIDMRRIQKTLERYGQRFERRCFTGYECQKAHEVSSKQRRVGIYAKRFAAKEACAKALGTGFAHGVIMRDIGVLEDENGKPFLKLKGGAYKRLELITPKKMTPIMHLSLSDDPPYAQAFVVIEAVPL